MPTNTTPDDNGADPAIEPPKTFAQSAAGVDPLSGQHFYALFRQHIRETGNEESCDEHERKLPDPRYEWSGLLDKSRVAYTRAAAEFIKPLLENIKGMDNHIRSLNENTITPMSAELEKLTRWREGITTTVARVAGPQVFTTLDGKYECFPGTERILTLLETLMSELEEYRACFRFLGHDMLSNPFGASRFAAMSMSRFEHLRESSSTKDVELMEARIRADDLACANASLSRDLGTVYEKVVVAANGIKHPSRLAPVFWYGGHFWNRHIPGVNGIPVGVVSWVLKQDAFMLRIDEGVEGRSPKDLLPLWMAHDPSGDFIVGWR